MPRVPDEPACAIYGLFLLADPAHTIKYVGQTSKTPWRRFRDHLNTAVRNDGSNDYEVPVHRWIRKHGVEAIGYRILEPVDSPDELDDREVYWIATLETQTKLRRGGLNVSPGGGSMRGVTLSTETREVLRKKRHSLTDEQVTEIKLRIWNGATMKDIAPEYGANEATLHGIRDNRTYLHVPWPIGPARKPEYMDRERERVAGLMKDPAVRERHLAGVKLSWTTERRAEMSKRMQEGHPMRGKKHKKETLIRAAIRNSPLSPEEILAVRELRAQGLQYKAIRERLRRPDVSLGTIGNIVRGDYYSLITEENLALIGYELRAMPTAA